MEKRWPWNVGRTAIPLGSGLILVCLIALSWVTYDRVRTAFGAKDWLAHTYQVHAELDEVYGTVATAESDVRAFMLSEDEPSFVRYKGSILTVRARMTELRRLTADNPRQTPLLDRLQTAIDLRYDYMDRTVDARQTRTLDEALAYLTNSPLKGKALEAMNAVRAATTASTEEEDRLLVLRKALSESAVVQAAASFVMTLAISVVLISAFAALSNRLVTVREAAANEERALRGDLESEIQRTKLAEAKLEKTMVELRRSNEELQNFAFVASHDLQEPLRKIRAFSDRVRRRSGATLDAESVDSLQRVEAAAERMQRLILDLLDLSRITTKVRPYVQVSLNKAVDEVVDDLQTRLEETRGNVERDDLPSVVADPAQLRQLLQNLIANALKFRREGVPPVVRIQGVTRSDGRVALRVSDNGIGFDPKYADRIFVVFQRLHGRGEYEGSGIGLSIVRKIVERHGGAIAASGRPGKGAEFDFDLPGESFVPASEATLNASDPE